MLGANKDVTRGGFGEYWLGSCYTASQLIGIRRETGADSRSIGIRRSLNSLALLAHGAAAAFNSTFCATVANVIPVLFLAIAVQSRAYDSLLKAVLYEGPSRPAAAAR